MWFFRKELILPDVRLSKSSAASKGQSAGSVQRKKGFFRKLMFWKKDKTDSSVVSPQDVTNIDTRDSLSMWYDSSAQVSPGPTSPAPAKTKKGLFGIFKKKADPNVPPKQPAKKEDDEGF
jgi:hypothetical protein